MSITNKFDLHLIVPAKLIGTIVELVQGEGILVKLEPHESNHHHTRKQVVHRYADGKRLKDMSGDELLRQFIQGKAKFTTLDVQREFTKHGFALGSASSRLSFAKTEGLIRQVSMGHYEVIK